MALVMFPFTGEPNTKIVKGIETSCGNDYSWIEDCVFNTDVVIGSLPMKTGDKFLAFVEEDRVFCLPVAN